MDDKYVAELKNETLRYTKVMNLNLLAHLHNRYGEIKPEMMDKNAKRMTRAWVCGTPFVKLTRRIEEGRAYVNAGGNSISNKRIIRIAFKIVIKTKHLHQA